MADILIKVTELETVVDNLDAIIEEFENATSRSEALEAAISTPFGKGQLRAEARDFEERWNDKRASLKDGLIDVRKRVRGVIDAVEKWDTDAAISLSTQE